MYEKEILALGDHCVPAPDPLHPIGRFETRRAKRVRAAEILVKIAQPWSVRDLIDLLGDYGWRTFGSMPPRRARTTHRQASPMESHPLNGGTLRSTVEQNHCKDGVFGGKKTSTVIRAHRDGRMKSRGLMAALESTAYERDSRRCRKADSL